MAKVYQFPKVEDRQNIHTAIQRFAQGKCSRMDMMTQVAWIMRKFRLKKITINNYTVKVEDYKGFPVVIVEGNRKSDKCPACGASPDDARYIRTRLENLVAGEDCITVTCLECGSIYDTMAPNTMENTMEWRGCHETPVKFRQLVPGRKGRQ